MQRLTIAVPTDVILAHTANISSSSSTLLMEALSVTDPQSTITANLNSKSAYNNIRNSFSEYRMSLYRSIRNIEAVADAFVDLDFKILG